MTQSTFSAQVANNLLTVLQGYSKTIRLLLVMFLTLTASAEVWSEEATLLFANKAQRTSFSTTKQVWAQNGVTFTNDKASSTNAVADYANPVRLYQNSSVTVACSLGNMTKIVFDCNNASYATAMKNSIGSSATASSDKVTVTLDGTSNTFAVAKLTAQVRLDGITVTYTSGGGVTPDPCTTPTVAWNTKPANGEVGGSMTASVTTDYSNGLTYSSSNQTVATVTNAGLINYLSAGTTTITATVTGDGTTFCEGPVSVQQEITITAPAGGDGECSWTLVTDASTLKVDDEVIITASGSATDNNYALSTNQKSNNRGGAAITKNGNTLTAPSADVQILTLKAGSSPGTLAFYTGASGYLYAASSTANQLKTKATLDVHGSWTISITDGVASIAATGSSNRNVMQYNYNNGTPLFACYASASQTSLAIYKKICSDDGGDDPTPTKLTKPTNLKVSNVTTTTATLSWDAVANANGYTVVVGSTYHNTDTTSITVENLTASTTYKWSVTAKGNGSTYTDSDAANGSDFTTKTTAPKTYTITFEANGGTKIDKITDATTLPNPLPETERDHYTFEGWFTDEGCTQAATAGAEINANTTLYAKWEPITYTVTFDAGSGTCATEPTQGNFEAGITLLTATPCDYASTNGWSFVGWSETTVSETTVRPTIHTGNYKPTKNITLHAVYAKTGTAQGGAGEFILSLQYEGTPYYVGQTFDNNKLSAETNQANAALFTIEDNYLHYEGGYISHVATTSSPNITKQADKANAQAWTIDEEGNTITFTSTADDTRGLGFNYNDGSPRFAAYQLSNVDYPHTFTKTSVSGGNIQVTTYNSKPSCVAPVDPTWVDAQITHTAIKANCGSTTVLGVTGENGPATISFSGTDLQNSVTVTASDGFLVSTDKTAPEKYAQSVIIYPNSTGSNIGKITQGVHVIANAPAQSGDYTGTITLTGNDIPGGSQVINVTAAVTCTQYTITWSVNGDDSHQVTYSPGDALQLPEIDVTPCDGMDYVGWTDNMGYDHGTDILFTETTDMTVTSDKTYYAVFATPTSSGGGETTLDFSKQGYANQATVNSLPIDAVTVTFDTGTNSNSNAPKYYTSGSAVRVYGGNTFTVNSDNTISNIVITFGTSDGTNKITTNTGNYEDGTWTGSANEIIFTIGGTSGNRRIKSIEVTSAGGATFYTGHTTTCSGSQQLATPTNLQATDITYNGATLTWNAVAGANSYKVVINGQEPTFVNTNSYTTHALKQQTAYTWTVQAIGNATTFTDSEISAEATFTTGTALTITWSVSTNTTTTTITKGQPIGANLKTPATPAACEGKVFMGWSASSTVKSDGSDFTPITSDIVPETNVTYYAVFAEPTGNGGAQGELFSESFTTMNGNGGNDGTWNGISSSTEVSIDGWSFTKGYVANQCIRLGTGSVAGQATTPALGINGSATLTFNAGAWNAQDEKTQINLTIVGEGSIEPSSVTLTKGQFTTYTANIKGANADTKVKFSAATKNDNRFFLDEVKVSGGTGNTTYTDYSTSCGTYTVTYYGFNSGGYTTTCNDNPAVDEVEQGGTYVIPNCEPTFDPAKLGRTFAGTWNTQANGKGTAYKPGDEIANVCNDITLYAQWALNTSEENTTLPTDVEDLATTDVVVTGGTTLTLAAGTTTINSLTLKGGLQENDTYAMPVVNIPEGATLVRNNNKINLDLKVNNKSYYPFAVPFEVANTAANVNYIDTTLKAYANANNGYGKYYRILEYNGALRAENGVNSDENWVHVGRTDVKLMPGKGYAISAVPAAGDDTVTIRITMTVDNAWLANGEQKSITVKEQTTTRNAVAVTAYTGAAANKDICNAGWNFVANPYLTNFTTNNHITGVDYIGGEIIVSNGQFVKDGTEVPYVTIPNANMSWYEQRRVEDAILSPMYSFFVQIAEGGTMTFETAGRQQAPAALRASSEQANPSFEADIVILNSQEQEADHTGLVINDRWSPAYEIGGDLEKMFGTANRTAIYTLSGNTRLAYNALSYNDALVAIPVGFRAQANGEYTIQLRNTEDIEDVESFELKDLYNNQTTNLLYNDYTFYSDATQEDSRFVVYLVPKKNTTTDISTITNGNTENRKIIFNNHLYIIHNGNIYNGTGQMVK